MRTTFLFLLLLSAISISLHAQVDRSKMPAPGPAPEVDLGSPSRFELDNGLQVIVVENHKLPRVSIKLVLDNKPYAYDRKAGLKSLYKAMMGNGTETMAKDTFNAKIDNLGANIIYGTKSARANTLSKFFPEVFSLMADGMLHAKFTNKEFKSQKKRLIEQIKADQNNVKAIAKNVQNALTFGRYHPYGEFATTESVKRINLKDIQSYYSNFITPKNAYLVVVGDVDLAEVKKLTQENYGKWQSETPPSVSLSKVNDVQYTQVDFVDVPSAAQSVVGLINPVKLKKSDSDYFPGLIANHILGGGSDGRLFKKLREDKAYTYGAYSSLSSDRYISDFKAHASVRTQVTDSAIVGFLNEIQRIRTEKVNTQELQLAKAKFSGHFVRSLENPSTIADYALTIEKNNLPDDFYRNYLKNIRAVTPEQVQIAATEFFKRYRTRIVVVGKGKDVIPQIENLSVDGKSIPVKYFNKKAQPVKKPKYKKDAPSGVTVGTVYQHYIDAIGGKDAVKQVRTFYGKYKGKMGPQTIVLIIEKNDQGQSLTLIKSGGQTLQKMVFDGEEGYIETQGKKRKFSENEIEEAKQQSQLFPELGIADGAKVDGLEKVDDKEARVIKPTPQKSVYYAKDSKLKLQEVTHTDMGASKTTFSDYKKIHDVKFPQTITRNFGPQTIEFNAEEIKINRGVSELDFQ